jgi:sugar (pentulose or hexulose) kinase
MRDSVEARDAIVSGRTALGIEFGSTRIKAVLIDHDHQVLAVGGHEWENQFVDRTWTYSVDAVWAGVQACFADLASHVRQRYDCPLETLGSLGISAMMHGYLAFDADDTLLVPFRTWRNTSTSEASAALSELFGMNIPQRWSISHLYQAVLNGEEHLPRLAHLTTLAGYVHTTLSGERVLGIGDASGMFPIDSATGYYADELRARFDAVLSESGLPQRLSQLLPRVQRAGQPAGHLTEAGARLLDPSGTLRAGAPMAPPEGDAGTGMVATNSVAPRTGNVSAGTSIFAMVVLERPLRERHPELDLVTTPAGDPVAMVHCNNGASELNSWAGVFTDFARRLGLHVDSSTIFATLFTAALEGDADGGGLLAYNYLSGEHNVGLTEGRPLVARTPDSSLTLANFMRVQLFSMLTTLRIGMDSLTSEKVELDAMFGHGGLFKTPGVGQSILAAALDTDVSVGEVAAEGGAWGMAVLAAYAAAETEPAGLADYLKATVFGDAELTTVSPDPAAVAGFNTYLERFRRGLPIEHTAIDCL